MRTSHVLSVCAAALLGAGAVVVHRMWTEDKPVQPVELVQAPVAAPRPMIPEALPPLETEPNEVPEPEPAPLSAPPPPKSIELSSEERRKKFIGSEKMAAFFVDSYRQPLDRLPYWLSIPESQRDDLASLIPMLSMHSMSAGQTQGEAEIESQYRQARAVDEIKALLGPEVYPLWREWHDSQIPRAVLAQVTAADTAPNEDWMRTVAAQLTAAKHKAEAEWRASPEAAAYTGSAAFAPRAGRRTAELMREAAAGYLSPTQMQAFDKWKEGYVARAP